MVKYPVIAESFRALLSVDTFNRKGKINQKRVADALTAIRAEVGEDNGKSCSPNNVGDWARGAKVPLRYQTEISVLLRRHELADTADSFDAFVNSHSAKEDGPRRRQQGRRVGEANRERVRQAVPASELALRRLVETLDDGCVPTVAELMHVGQNGQTEAEFWYKFGSLRTDNLMPPYDARTVDVDLDEALKNANSDYLDDQTRVVMVAGPPKSGKTRSLIEALNRRSDLRHLPFHDIAGPLDEYIALDGHEKAVVFLDDIHERISQNSRGKIVADLAAICRLGHVLAITAHPPMLDTPTPEEFGLSPQNQRWLQTCPTIRLAAELDPEEAKQHNRPENFRLAEDYAGILQLLHRVGSFRTPGGRPSAVAQACNACLSALIDTRLFSGGGIDAARLRVAAQLYWDLENPTRPLTDHTWDEAINFLTEPIGGSGSTLAIVSSRGGYLVLLEALTVHLISGHVSKRRLTHEDRRLAANTCIFLGCLDDAAGWLEQSAVDGDPRAVERLAYVWNAQGRHEEASELVVKAARSGDQHAMVILDDVREAEQLLREAYATSPSSAYMSLNFFLHNQGRVDEASEIMLRAAESGWLDGSRMANRVMFEVEDQTQLFDNALTGADLHRACVVAEYFQVSGDHQRADVLFEVAANLAAELSPAEMVDAASFILHFAFPGTVTHLVRPLFELAASLGETNALVLHAVGFDDESRFLERGPYEEAERLLRQAIADGSSEARVPLGELLSRQGRDVEAEHLLQEAAELTEAGALGALGHLLSCTDFWPRVGSAHEFAGYEVVTGLHAGEDRRLDAIGYFERAIDANPDELELIIALAWVLAGLRRTEEAHQVLLSLADRGDESDWAKIQRHSARSILRSWPPFVL